MIKAIRRWFHAAVLLLLCHKQEFAALYLSKVKKRNTRLILKKKKKKITINIRLTHQKELSFQVLFSSLINWWKQTISFQSKHKITSEQEESD